MAGGAKMSEQQLTALCDEWSRMFRLQDWRISARLVRSYELGDESGGRIEIAPSRGAARIKIIHPDDVDPDNDQSIDTEGYLVHELLHVLFRELDDDLGEYQKEAFERALNKLSECLVALKKGAK